MKKYKIVSSRISRTMIRAMVMPFDLGFFTSSVKYVTAAVSGTEYSGELAASDLMVTCMFMVTIG